MILPTLRKLFPKRRTIHQYATVPANFFNEGRVVIGVNTSSYRIKRYFQDEQALVFSVDATGAPEPIGAKSEWDRSVRCWNGRLRRWDELKSAVDRFPENTFWGER